jgi:DNA-binding transcriptional LysR family regulator
MESWLSEQDWISYSPDLPIIRRYWQMVFGRRPDILPKFIIPDLLSIIRAVELGLGLSIVSTYLCRRALEEQRISMLSIAPQEIGNQLYIACRPNRLRSAEIEWLTGLLNAYSNEKK